MTRAIVTGGASFIGSHLVERLLQGGDEVTVIDNLSSGSMENIRGLGKGHNLHTLIYDLRDVNMESLHNLFKACDADIVYHLAADHGGRGYVETKQVACSNNFALDNNVIQATISAEIPRLVFASSGCMYPLNLQGDPNQVHYLKESEGGPPYWPDGLYGMAKLAAEETLWHAYSEYGLQSTSCRFFTVYGPRAKENHAVISFIARAFIRQDPFVLWGDGTQVRNWTHVTDIVNGLLLSSVLSGYNTINLGTMERITVHEAAVRTIELVNEMFYNGTYQPKIEYDVSKPVGPLNRVADNKLYFELGGEPLKKFEDGLRETLIWYFETKNPHYVKENFERLQIERK